MPLNILVTNIPVFGQTAQLTGRLIFETDGTRWRNGTGGGLTQIGLVGVGDIDVRLDSSGSLRSDTVVRCMERVRPGGLRIDDFLVIELFGFNGQVLLIESPIPGRPTSGQGQLYRSLNPAFQGAINWEIETSRP
jgi:hypothetical protein